MSEGIKRFLKDPADQKRFLNVMQESLVQETLSKIFGALEQEIESKETSLAQYEEPSWAFAQADRNGARRNLRTLRKILNIN